MASIRTDTRLRLAVLWVFVMLNMIFADIVTFMRADVITGFLAGDAEGLAITPSLLLVVALITEVPIAMVALSLLLPQRVARAASIAAAVLTIAYVWGGASFAPYYFFFAAVETMGCLLLLRTAWSWRVAAAGGRAHVTDEIAPREALA